MPDTSRVSRESDVVELAEVRAGEVLDWDRLVAYLRCQVPELVGEFSVQQFPNGSANLTYLLHFGEQRVVMRRPPFGLIAPGAHDMRREYKILSQLWRFYPAAPRALHLCTDHSVIGSDFVLMEYRSGEVLWGKLSPSMQSLPGAAIRVGRSVVKALAELHLLDPAACDLTDLGRPDGFVARQVDGWRKRWDLVAEHAREDTRNAAFELAAELRGTMPAPQRVSILHNDYKIDNCQFVPGEPDRVGSVFDWDMATLGDPLVDLGTLLNYWPDPSDTPDDRPVTPDGLDTMGLPSRAEMSGYYASITGLDLSGARWYEAFACFKTAVALQQFDARWARGETTDRRMADRGGQIDTMVRRSARLLAG
jgi:aminoglycoside phosphotransferase (APT) family kinase protein